MYVTNAKPGQKVKIKISRISGPSSSPNGRNNNPFFSILLITGPVLTSCTGTGFYNSEMQRAVGILWMKCNEKKYIGKKMMPLKSGFGFLDALDELIAVAGDPLAGLLDDRQGVFLVLSW